MIDVTFILETKEHFDVAFTNFVGSEIRFVVWDEPPSEEFIELCCGSISTFIREQLQSYKIIKPITKGD